jgi:hypothetical protein
MSHEHGRRRRPQSGGGGAGFGVQEAGGNPSGGAMPVGARRPTQFARERGFLQLPSGSCKLRRKEPRSLFKIVGSSLQFIWPLASDVVDSEYEMTASDGVGCASSG